MRPTWEYGVREYWVIDPDAQEIEVIHLESEPLQRTACRGNQAIGSAALPDFAETADGFFFS